MWYLTAFLVLCIATAFEQLEAQSNSDGSTPYLLFGNRELIRQANLDGSGILTIVNNTNSERPNALGIDYDYRRGYVFWIEGTRQTIMRSYLNGSDPTVLVNTGLAIPDGLAWDWINMKLYWTDAGSNHRIEVYDPETEDRRVLFLASSNSRLRSIVVDPITGWMYWSDWSHQTPKIERASMDGENRSVIINETDLGFPTALTLDYESQTLYWTDALLHRIESSGVDGSNRMELTGTMVQNPYAMTFFSGRLFWSDWDLLHSVLTTTVSSPDDVQRIISLAFNPTGLHVVSEARQAFRENPCRFNNGGCTHFCLLSAVAPAGYSCVCPDGIEPEMERNCSEPQLLVVPTTTLQPGGEATSLSTGLTVQMMPTPGPPIEPQGICNQSAQCENGGTCVNINPSEYLCICASSYVGRNCESGGITNGQDKNSGDLNISAPIFAGVVGGLVLIIILMVFLALCLVAAVSLSGRHKMGQAPSYPGNTSPHSASQLVERGEPEYMSIPSANGSPAPVRHQLTLPHTGNHYEETPRSSVIDDPLMKGNSEYGVRSVKIRTL